MFIQGLFPTAIGLCHNDKGVSQQTVESINMLEKIKNVGNISSMDKYVLKQKYLSELSDFIDKSVNEYFLKIYDPKTNVKLKITQSWINWCETSQFHHNHTHACSFISGIYYINADKQTDKIFFVNNAYDFFDIVSNSFNMYNSKDWWFPVGTGDLVLFPSKLAHEVRRVESAKTRISLAFNTFLHGDIGEEMRPTKLHLKI